MTAVEVGDAVERVSDGMPGVVLRVGTSDLAWWETLTDAQRRANARNTNRVCVRWVLRGSQWLSRRTLGTHWRITSSRDTEETTP